MAVLIAATTCKRKADQKDKQVRKKPFAENVQKGLRGANKSLRANQEVTATCREMVRKKIPARNTARLRCTLKYEKGEPICTCRPRDTGTQL